MEFTFKRFYLIAVVLLGLLTCYSAKSVQESMIPRGKTRWLADEVVSICLIKYGYVFNKSIKKISYHAHVIPYSLFKR